MSRLFVLSGFACLSVVAACVDLTQPSEVIKCAKDHKCTDNDGGSGGTRGSGGGSAGSAGGVAGSAGGVAGGGGGTAGASGGAAGRDAGAAGAGAGNTNGGAAGVGAAGTTGAGGGGATGTAGAEGGDASMGGTTDTGDAGGGGSSGSEDAGIDAPLPGPETVPTPDTNPRVPDTPQEAAREVPGADTGGPESGRDAMPDITPDQAPDLMPDTSLDTTPPDTPSCIQKLQSAGYAVQGATDSGVQACSDCKENGMSQEAGCKGMIDCLQTAWPCAQGESCWNTCLNKNGDAVLGTCVATLTSKACAAH